MKKSHEMKRRDFLRSSTGAAAALFAFSAQSNAAEPKPSGPLAELMSQMESDGRKMLSVPRRDGQFLNLQVKAARAKNILEIGTSQGYSAIWIALALQETGGKLTTIDIDADKVALAKSNLAKARLEQNITFLHGDAHQLLPGLDGVFDFVFLDADKDGQLDYFNKLHPNKLARGGIIAVHNAIRMSAAMKPYFDAVQSHPEYDSIILSLTMDDGFSVSYRHRS